MIPPSQSLFQAAARRTRFVESISFSLSLVTPWFHDHVDDVMDTHDHNEQPSSLFFLTLSVADKQGFIARSTELRQHSLALL